MIKFKSIPKFKKLNKYLSEAKRLDPKSIMHEYGKKGVSALAAATPADTGETSRAWSYKVAGNRKRYTITWTNSVMAGSTPLVVLLQYGHGTKSGYFLRGNDFINPALRPLYQSFARRLGQEIF